METKIILKKFVRALTILFLVSIIGCQGINSNKISLETPSALAHETQVFTSVPSSTPASSPTPDLAYSYLPVISSGNATKVADFDTISGEVSSVAFSPNGKYLAASFANDVGIIWDLSTVRSWGEWRKAKKDIFLSKGTVSFNADSTVLAAGGTLFDIQTMKIIQELPGSLVAFNPDGKNLILYEWGTESLWHFDGNHWVLVNKEEKRYAVSFVYNHDGNLLAEAMHWGGGESVNIWRVTDHKLLYSFSPPEHEHAAHFNFDTEAFVAFSPDGRLVATGTKDQPTIRIWDLTTGKLIKDLNTVVEINSQDPSSGKIMTEYYIPDVKAVAFSKDSSVLVVVGGDSVLLRLVPNGELLRRLKLNSYVLSATYLTALAISSDGKFLVTGDSEGNVKLWSIPAKAP